MNTTPKLLFFFSVLSILILRGVTSCKPDTGSSDGVKKVAQLAVDWSKGDCIDRPLSPYVYQISAIEGDKVYLYRMGEMGKKVVQKTVDQLKEGTEPFQKIPCP